MHYHIYRFKLIQNDYSEVYMLQDNSYSQMNSNPVINDRSRILQLESELSQTKKTLSETKEKLAILLDNMPGGVFSYDAESGKFDFLSPGCLEIFSCTEPQFRERYFDRFEMLVSKEDRERIKTQINEQLSFFDTVELTYRTSDIFDEVKWIYHRARLVKGSDGSSKFYVVISDITDEKLVQDELSAKAKRLRAKSERDPMTGLYNKVSMQQAIKDCLLESTDTPCHAMLMIDTDNFKSVNDTFGHQYGDKIILFVSDAIKRIFRESDFVGRMGGDEFMVFMRHTTPAITELKAKLLNDAIRKTLTENGKTVSISCSIGISFYPKHAKDYDKLYAAADAALYISKENGKDRFTVSR